MILPMDHQSRYYLCITNQLSEYLPITQIGFLINLSLPRTPLYFDLQYCCYLFLIRWNCAGILIYFWPIFNLKLFTLILQTRGASCIRYQRKIPNRFPDDNNDEDVDYDQWLKLWCWWRWWWWWWWWWTWWWWWWLTWWWWQSPSRRGFAEQSSRAPQWWTTRWIWGRQAPTKTWDTHRDYHLAIITMMTYAQTW